MKKPSKIEELNKNMALAKSDRVVPHKSAVRKINLKDIECNPARQPREEIDASYVSDLKDALTNGGQLPAIIVFSTDGNAPYFIADGWHRLKANEDFKQIEAEVREGDAQAAFYFSLQANNSHGKRLTNADKRRKVTLALADEGMSAWSDRRLSDWCGVSAMLVGEVRGSGVSSYTSDHKSTESKPEKPKARTGKDGKSYPAKPKVEKKITDKPAPKEDLIRDSEPNAEEPDEVTGEIAECDKVACADNRRLVKTLERKMRAANLEIGRLREDKEAEMQRSPFYKQAMKVFEYWKEKTGHSKSHFSLDVFKQVLPFLRKDGEDLCMMAVEGIAFQHHKDIRLNGTEKKYDSFELCFRNRAKFEEYCNRSPRHKKGK